jgi:uncharacterized metal-binding protein
LKKINLIHIIKKDFFNKKPQIDDIIVFCDDLQKILLSGICVNTTKKGNHIVDIDSRYVKIISYYVVVTQISNKIEKNKINEKLIIIQN